MSDRVATDVGGTFTDLVHLRTDPDTGRQEIVTAKADTTPPDFERGVLEVIARAGVDPAEVGFLVHGTTVVINALTERNGVPTGLITTEGFRDSLEIARGNRPDFFNLFYEKPAPFVPRHLRRELPGRLAPTGAERQPLDLSGLPAILADFRAAGVEAVAICLLHAYADPRHERAVLERVGELWPEVSVVASHQITREWREYERSSTAVLSAYVQPIAERYLTRLEQGLAERGYGGRPYIMQSNCGVDTLAHVKRVPITMVESGPASGFWGAAELGRLIGEPNVLALDVGGTTAKCSLIEGGHVRIVTDYWIERDRRSAGYPIMVPVVDLVEIGNGGGSIAWVDDFGKLHVGPRSAGAVPGPAAYGQGGTDATTTDANLALGRLNAENFRGGQRAEMDAAGRALDAVAARLGGDRTAAARGIVRIADHNMINALKLVSVNRGFDPRDFTLVAFGGGGGMHAAALAAELGMRKVVIPRAADVFSAWGMLMTDLRRDFFVTRLATLNAGAAGTLEQLVRETRERAAAQLADEGAGEARYAAFGRLRYENQEHSVEVPLPDGEITADAVTDIVERFHATYEREYTYRLDAPVELVGLHLVAAVEVGKLVPAELPVTGADVASARTGEREVDFAPAPAAVAGVYAGDALEPGMEIAGPAVVETSGATTVVRPGDRARVDAYGNLHIEVGARA
jgi:N-methylhydantoinase A